MVLEEDTIQFTCKSPGGSPVWKFNNNDLLKNTEVFQNNLVVNNLHHGNSGTYQCYSKTDNGEVKYSEAELTVLSEFHE